MKIKKYTKNIYLSDISGMPDGIEMAPKLTRQQ
jgi:hypothetical protein